MVQYGSRPGGGIGRFDGTSWRFYHNADAGFPINEANTLTIDHTGAKWFTTSSGGVGRFDGSTWTLFTPTNSGLLDSVSGIAIDRDGSAWFSSSAGLSRFDGSTWTTYRSTTFGGMFRLAIDHHGVKWGIASMSNMVRFDGTSWQSYPIETSGTVLTLALTIDTDDNKWFYGRNSAAYVLWGGTDFPLTDNVQWRDSQTWRATYDITSLVPRGAQALSISSAQGTDGIEVVSDGSFMFTVDYAGTISDRTAPEPPWIFTTGIPGDPSAVRITGSAGDSESGIAAYRYAIGTTAGATNIINWTIVPTNGQVQALSRLSSSNFSMTRTNLGLMDGTQYWVSIQAQNSGGLWSISRASAFIAGQQSIINVYLPLVSNE